MWEETQTLALSLGTCSNPCYRNFNQINVILWARCLYMLWKILYIGMFFHATWFLNLIIFLFFLEQVQSLPVVYWAQWPDQQKCWQTALVSRKKAESVVQNMSTIYPRRCRRLHCHCSSDSTWTEASPSQSSHQSRKMVCRQRWCW